MRKIVIAVVLSVMAVHASARENVGKILAEGKQLYRLERASWHGTDALLEMFPEKLEQIGGQLSYLDEKGRAVNIFWRKGDPSQILARLCFETPLHTIPSAIDTLNTVANPLERDLIEIREDARRTLTENEDGFFSFYQNTSSNLIPLIDGGRRMVFIVAAPRDNGVVLLGNDYRLTYDKKNRLKKKEQLHKSLIRLKGRSGDPENPISVTVHSHVLSDLITSTDICTLLLYRDFVDWRQHVVVGKKYVSIFDLYKESVETMKIEAFKKMIGEGEEGPDSR